MKKTLLMLAVVCTMGACVKNETLTPVVQTPAQSVTDGKQEALGSFLPAVHSVSGSVKLIIDKNDAKKRFLSFENFKTDEGPDLYVYLAEDKSSKGFISVAKLTKTGTFTLEIPEGAVLEKQKHVLIWCQQFSVLFGSAKLE
ncbi:DM13 domain-containing protein [Arcicella sp. LKC2W]|uniref:DM13 domain-containing protein n=1 Tax=Arcicella sp. LKC2W TaxID=2984198 RepID=UPI002B205974|nr:DM13 domain-containing protein [Arcicella sp. LKC2W]MEA5459314.1 DM13 domain-containing protein [Arcicella sp. LKC2W]